jgi:RNA polymerase sigma factor (sigma-70 family)
MQPTLNELAQAAQNGSQEALEAVIRQVQGNIYNLALRMLQSPADAEDATQEILIRLVTHLNQFRGESSFMTWAYRVASNTLLNIDRRNSRRRQVSFDDLSARLEASLAVYEATPEEAHEDAALTEEVRRNCTLGMLMCLSIEDRLALVLGELFEVSSDEGAVIMGVSSAAYRKRLSRARAQLVSFVSRQCGLFDPEHPCLCHKHVRNKIAAGLLDPRQLQYVQPGEALDDGVMADTATAGGDTLCRTLALVRAHPTYRSRADFAETLRRMLTQTDADPDVY